MQPQLLDIIGNTPLVQLPFSTPCELLGKLEYFNPGGSIKDRSAKYMIEAAEKSGKLKPGGTIIEGSSGNQGIAIAMIGAIKGYKVIITVPERTSTEKVNTLRAYGAKVIICDATYGTHGYTDVAHDIHQQTPNSIILDQYVNPLNMAAHYHSTGPEIWQQTAGKLTHIIMAMGSCGTISGVGKYLKEQNPNIQVIGVDAENSQLSSDNPKPYLSEGIGVDVIENGLYHPEYVDICHTISDRDAFQMTRRIAKAGLLAGISSGAVMHIALQFVQQCQPTDKVVCLLGDSGRAYLDKVFSPTAAYQSKQIIAEEAAA